MQSQFSDIRPEVTFPFLILTSTTQNSQISNFWIGKGNFWISCKILSSILATEIFLVQNSKAMYSESECFFKLSSTTLWDASKNNNFKLVINHMINLYIAWTQTQIEWLGNQASS